MPRKSVQLGAVVSPVVRACVRSMRIGAAAVARGCVAIGTVAVKVSSSGLEVGEAFDAVETVGDLGEVLVGLARELALKPDGLP